MPKVSVIVPVYIDQEYKRDYFITCLNSLLNQSLKDIEIICINDCSPIDISDIISKYKEYPNIRFLENDHNMGAGFSRNKGLDLASGEYITFVDSDDYINLDMYKNLYESAKENNFPDLIETNISFVKDDSFANKNHQDQYVRPRLLKPQDQIQNILYISPSTCNKLWKKELVDKTRFINTSMWEDYAFTYSLYMQAKTVLDSTNFDYYYRKSANNTVSAKSYSYNENFFDIFIIVNEILKHQNPAYQEEIELLKYGLIFGRIHEISNWKNSDPETINKIKTMMYAKTYELYGPLPETLDTAMLSMLAGFQTIDEYKTLYPTKKR